MLDLMERCFGTEQWKEKIREMIPSYRKKLGEDARLIEQVREESDKVLRLGGFVNRTA